MKKISFYTFIFAAISLFHACSSNQEQGTVRTTDSLSTSNETVQLANQPQNEVFKKYVLLKDALVISDAAKSQTAAADLATSLKADPSWASLAEMADSIAQDKNLVTQRSTFNNLNNALIPVFKKAVLSKGSFYVQFCPMANEGTGGYWLATETEVRNPYYGDEMLNCGEVKETIK